MVFTHEKIKKHGRKYSQGRTFAKSPDKPKSIDGANTKDSGTTRSYSKRTKTEYKGESSTYFEGRLYLAISFTI